MSVLIVGAGPVGLALAVELARRGVQFRIIERLTERSHLSKALGVHARTLELFEDMGVFDEFSRRGVVVHGASVYDKRKRIFHISTDELDCPHPFVLMIPQSETEKILEAKLNELGGKVERGSELIGLTQNGNVNATIRHSDGSQETLQCEWMIGCDGAHSAVRKLLGIKFEGEAYEETFAAVDCALAADVRRDEVNTFFSEHGTLVVFPLPAGRWRIIYQVKEARDKDAAPTLEEAQHMLDVGGPGGTISDPTWLAYFRISRRHVSNYRQGRVFIAGDAAHIHSPLGGQGMNTGIQDAVNLAWKLQLTLSGIAKDALLDSYHDERYPIAKDVLHGTDFATKVAMLRSPVSQSIRNQVMAFLVSQEVIQQRILRAGSEIAVNYRSSKIVGEYRGNIFGTAPEVPSVLEFIEFANGPRSGDRAPDVCFVDGNGADTRLFDVIRGQGFKLLLFDGSAASSQGYTNLKHIAAAARNKFGDLMTIFVVSQHDNVPPELLAATILIADKQMDVHRKFGANSECLYLIRPDGYIGFRSQPADWEKLQEHMDVLLGRS